MSCILANNVFNFGFIYICINEGNQQQLFLILPLSHVIDSLDLFKLWLCTEACPLVFVWLKGTLRRLALSLVHPTAN